MDAKSIIEKLRVAEKDLQQLASALFSALSEEVEICQATFFRRIEKGDERVLKYVAGFAVARDDTDTLEFPFGEGLAGQVAADGKPLIFNEVPEGYMKIVSGLGEASPRSLLIYPIKHEGEVLGLVELAAFRSMGEQELALMKALEDYLGQELSRAYGIKKAAK